MGSRFLIADLSKKLKGAVIVCPGFFPSAQGMKRSSKIAEGLRFALAIARCPKNLRGAAERGDRLVRIARLKECDRLVVAGFGLSQLSVFHGEELGAKLKCGGRLSVASKTEKPLSLSQGIVRIIAGSAQERILSMERMTPCRSSNGSRPRFMAILR